MVFSWRWICSPEASGNVGSIPGCHSPGGGALTSAAQRPPQDTQGGPASHGKAAPGPGQQWQRWAICHQLTGRSASLDHRKTVPSTLKWNLQRVPKAPREFSRSQAAPAWRSGTLSIARHNEVWWKYWRNPGRPSDPTKTMQRLHIKHPWDGALGGT